MAPPAELAQRQPGRCAPAQRQLVAAAALEWQSANRDVGFLLADLRLAQFEGWAAGTDVALTQSERGYLDASVAQRQAQEDAEAERQRRELEAAQTLAETEKQRAEEQTRSAVRLRQRAVYLVFALGAALVLLIATLGLAQLSNQNLVAARTANTRAVAEGPKMGPLPRLMPGPTLIAALPPKPRHRVKEMSLTRRPLPRLKPIAAPPLKPMPSRHARMPTSRPRWPLPAS